jgi:hypothetical protein
MYVVYFAVPYTTQQSALDVNTPSIPHGKFQLHCSSLDFSQHGMHTLGELLKVPGGT